MEFVALDVETANADVSSICQIGLAGFKGGLLVGSWSSLVNPEVKFSDFNIDIHGLGPATVAGAPRLPELAATLRSWLDYQVVVSHTGFDQRALERAFAKYGLPGLNCRWLDSAWAARRAWAGESPEGYSLRAICDLIGYEFKHHDALEDAKAAGEIMLAAGRRAGLTAAGWLKLAQSSA